MTSFDFTNGESRKKLTERLSESSKRLLDLYKSLDIIEDSRFITVEITTSLHKSRFSLKYLLCYDVPFVKIANRPDLYWLAGEVPRKIHLVISTDKRYDYNLNESVYMLHCISEYPATAEQYEREFSDEQAKYLSMGISDHTTDFTLYHKYNPDIYECHYKLSDSTGLDAGSFSRTPAQLAEIL